MDIKVRPIKKGQAVIEYLTTYAWAILVIAIVLALLFYLGVFNPSFFAPKAAPGSCQVTRPLGPMTTQYISLTGGAVCNQVPQFVGTFMGTSTSNFLNTTRPLALQNANAITISMWVQTNDYADFYGNSQQWWQGLAGNLATCPCQDNPPYGGVQLTGFTCPSPSDILFMAYDYQTGPASYLLYPAGSYFTSGTNCNPKAAIPRGAWMNIAATFNSITGNAVVYINGQIFQQGNLGTGRTINSQIPFYIGTDAWTLWSPYCVGHCNDVFNGSISNVQVYNLSLSQSQVQTLYSEGIGGAPLPKPILNNLVAWWPLNGNLNDYSGNNNPLAEATKNGGLTLQQNFHFSSGWWYYYTPPPS